MIKPTINTFFAHHNISVWLLLFMFSFPAHAQSITIVRSSIGHNIGSSLQTHTEPQYNAQYVVGQLIASSSISVDNYKIAHGFIQPLIWGESLSDYTDDIFWDIELVTFPNPVFQNLFVQEFVTTEGPTFDQLIILASGTPIAACCASDSCFLSHASHKTAGGAMVPSFCR